jgi:hypothetical protein
MDAKMRDLALLAALSFLCPFVQMKNTPEGPSRGADFQARHSARAIDHWSVDRRLVTQFMPDLPHSCHV